MELDTNTIINSCRYFFAGFLGTWIICEALEKGCYLLKLHLFPKKVATEKVQTKEK